LIKCTRTAGEDFPAERYRLACHLQRKKPLRLYERRNSWIAGQY
jgi:hypothetical protein